MNREITVVYTPKFTKAILWILWINSIGLTSFTAFLIACLLFLPIILLRGYVFYILGAILVGVCFFIIIINRSKPQINNSIAESNRVEAITVRYKFTDNQLEIETDTERTAFLWQEIKNVNNPTVWLLLFSGMSNHIALPTNKLDRELKQFITYQFKEKLALPR